MFGNNLHRYCLKTPSMFCILQPRLSANMSEILLLLRMRTFPTLPNLILLLRKRTFPALPNLVHVRVFMDEYTGTCLVLTR